MAEDVKPKDEPKPGEQDPGKPAPESKREEPKEEPGPIPYERFKEVNERAKSLEARLAELEKAQEEAKRKEAEEAGKFEELYKAEKAKAEAAALANLRLEVALAKGLPREFAARLKGSTQEEIEADAEALLPLVKAADGGPGIPGPGRGKPGEPLNTSKMSPEEIRKNRDKILANLRG